MAAVVGSLIAAIMLSGIGWLVLGNRFDFDEDERQNDILNLGAYAGAIFLLGLLASLVLSQL